MNTSLLFKLNIVLITIILSVTFTQAQYYRLPNYPSSYPTYTKTTNQYTIPSNYKTTQKRKRIYYNPYTNYSPRQAGIRYNTKQNPIQFNTIYPIEKQYKNDSSSYWNNPARHISGPNLVVHTTGITQDGITNVTNNPIDIMKINIVNNSNSTGGFVEAINLKNMKFRLVSDFHNNFSYNDFSIIINGENYHVDKTGTVTAYFSQSRIAQGEDYQINVQVKVNQPQNSQFLRGSVQLKILDINGKTELSSKNVTTKIIGNATSKYVSWDATPEHNQDLLLNSHIYSDIYSKMLSAGTQELVLSANFSAYYDDMVIDEIIINEELSGGNIAKWTRRLTAINLNTGTILGHGYFAGNEARIRFNEDVYIRRNNSVRIGFRIELRDQIRAGQHAQFKLNILPQNVKVHGVANGRELRIESKNFKISSEIFYIAGTTGNINQVSTQPSLITNGSVEPIYYFQISNNGEKNMSIGRISFRVTTQGLSFPGGSFSSDDVDLRTMSGNQMQSYSKFSPTILDDTVIFDLSGSEFYIAPGSTQKFALLLGLENSDNNINGDQVTINLLSDNNPASGSLLDLQTQNFNFIWSDNTTISHSISSKDWLSGYLFRGLSSETFVNKR